jgi:transcriptional regulator with XRE-family HTH domain
LSRLEASSVNIGEVARRAKVSRSTVSYALSGKRPVSESTRRRIQQVIDEMGYRPNAFARALARGETKTLGLVFPPAGSHYTDMQLDFMYRPSRRDRLGRPGPPVARTPVCAASVGPGSPASGVRQPI